MESIVDKRPKAEGEGDEYLVRWKGYGEEDDTWVRPTPRGPPSPAAPVTRARVRTGARRRPRERPGKAQGIRARTGQEGARERAGGEERGPRGGEEGENRGPGRGESCERAGEAGGEGGEGGVSGGRRGR